MIYIEKIKVVNKTQAGTKVLKKNFEIICSDVNLLVGNQGCGKSTMLKLLQKNHSDLKLSLTEDVIKRGISSFFFDSEKDNPRIKDPNEYTDINGKNIGMGYGNALISRLKSHGEIMETLIIDCLYKAKDCVVLLDEPESGLSITNQFKLINAIEAAVENGCQLFIATHCYPLIKRFNVISLEHNKQLSGVDFINKVKI